MRVHHWILFDNNPNSVNIILQKKNSLKEKKYCCDNKLLIIKTYLTTNKVIGGGEGKMLHPLANNNVVTILARIWSTFTAFHAVNIKYRYTTRQILEAATLHIQCKLQVRVKKLFAHFDSCELVNNLLFSTQIFQKIREITVISSPIILLQKLVSHYRAVNPPCHQNIENW